MSTTQITNQSEQNVKLPQIGMKEKSSSLTRISRDQYKHKRNLTNLISQTTTMSYNNSKEQKKKHSFDSDITMTTNSQIIPQPSFLNKQYHQLQFQQEQLRSLMGQQKHKFKKISKNNTMSSFIQDTTTTPTMNNGCCDNSIASTTAANYYLNMNTLQRNSSYSIKDLFNNNSTFNNNSKNKSINLKSQFTENNNTQIEENKEILNQNTSNNISRLNDILNTDKQKIKQKFQSQPYSNISSLQQKKKSYESEDNHFENNPTLPYTNSPLLNVNEIEKVCFLRSKQVKQDFYFQLMGTNTKKSDPQFLSDIDLLKQKLNQQKEISTDDQFIQRMKNITLLKQKNISIPHNSQNASLKKSNERKDLFLLSQWMETMLEKLFEKDKKYWNYEDFFDQVEIIYTGCLQEIARQVSIECSERGQIVMNIWEIYTNIVHHFLNKTHSRYIAKEVEQLTIQKSVQNMYTNDLQLLSEEKNKLQELLELRNNQISKAKAENRYLCKKWKKTEKAYQMIQDDFNAQITLYEESLKEITYLKMQQEEYLLQDQIRQAELEEESNFNNNINITQSASKSRFMQEIEKIKLELSNQYQFLYLEEKKKLEEAYLIHKANQEKQLHMAQEIDKEDEEFGKQTRLQEYTFDDILLANIGVDTSDLCKHISFGTDTCDLVEKEDKCVSVNMQKHTKVQTTQTTNTTENKAQQVNIRAIINDAKILSIEEQHFLNHISTTRFQDYIKEYKEFKLGENIIREKEDYGKEQIEREYNRIKKDMRNLMKVSYTKEDMTERDFGILSDYINKVFNSSENFVGKLILLFKDIFFDKNTIKIERIDSAIDYDDVQICLSEKNNQYHSLLNIYTQNKIKLEKIILQNKKNNNNNNNGTNGNNGNNNNNNNNSNNLNNNNNNNMLQTPPIKAIKSPSSPSSPIDYLKPKKKGNLFQKKNDDSLNNSFQNNKQKNNIKDQDQKENRQKITTNSNKKSPLDKPIKVTGGIKDENNNNNNIRSILPPPNNNINNKQILNNIINQQDQSTSKTQKQNQIDILIENSKVNESILSNKSDQIRSVNTPKQKISLCLQQQQQNQYNQNKNQQNDDESIESNNNNNNNSINNDSQDISFKMNDSIIEQNKNIQINKNQSGSYSSLSLEEVSYELDNNKSRSIYSNENKKQKISKIKSLKIQKSKKSLVMLDKYEDPFYLNTNTNERINQMRIIFNKNNFDNQSDSMLSYQSDDNNNNNNYFENNNIINNNNVLQDGDYDNLNEIQQLKYHSKISSIKVISNDDDNNNNINNNNNILQNQDSINKLDGTSKDIISDQFVSGTDININDDEGSTSLKQIMNINTHKKSVSIDNKVITHSIFSKKNSNTHANNNNNNQLNLNYSSRSISAKYNNDSQNDLNHYQDSDNDEYINDEFNLKKQDELLNNKSTKPINSLISRFRLFVSDSKNAQIATELLDKQLKDSNIKMKKSKDFLQLSTVLKTTSQCLIEIFKFVSNAQSSIRILNPYHIYLYDTLVNHFGQNSMTVSRYCKYIRSCFYYAQDNARLKIIKKFLSGEYDKMSFQFYIDTVINLDESGLNGQGIAQSTEDNQWINPKIIADYVDSVFGRILTKDRLQKTQRYLFSLREKLTINNTTKLVLDLDQCIVYLIDLYEEIKLSYTKRYSDLFNCVDIKNNGLLDYNQFQLLFKNFEDDLYLYDQFTSLELFHRESDHVSVYDKNKKMISLLRFTQMSIDHNLFTLTTQNNFLDCHPEEEILSLKSVWPDMVRRFKMRLIKGGRYNSLYKQLIDKVNYIFEKQRLIHKHATQAIFTIKLLEQESKNAMISLHMEEILNSELLDLSTAYNFIKTKKITTKNIKIHYEKRKDNS